MPSVAAAVQIAFFMNLADFSDFELPGGFRLTSITCSPAELLDPIGRPALAKATIEGRKIDIVLASDLNEIEQSLSIYHEILEALTVGFDDPPHAVLMMNEGDFELAARQTHDTFGFASPQNVRDFLRKYGFYG